MIAETLPIGSVAPEWCPVPDDGSHHGLYTRKEYYYERTEKHPDPADRDGTG